MRYKKSKQTYIIRIEKGEEILCSLRAICKKEKITCGHFHGIGAVSQATLGFFDPSLKRYFEKEFKESMEIVMISGNISLKEGEVIIHSHIILSRKDYSVIGGHLFEGRIGVTGEVFLTALPGKIERAMDEETGLSLLKL